MKPGRFLLFLAALLFAAAPPSFSQFKDFRHVIVIKANGDSIRGKVNYKTSFSKHNSILIKSGQSKQEIPVNDLSKIVFSDGETFRVLDLHDSIETRILARTLIDGSIGLHEADKVYYIEKDTAFFKLENKSIIHKRNGQEFWGPSKKYLVTLNRLFTDCPNLDYKPLATNIKEKPLTKLVSDYAKCKNISIKKVARKSAIELNLSAGPLGLKLSSSLFNGPVYSSSNGSSFDLSFLTDLGSSNRFKLRVDLNYMKSKLTGAFTEPYVVEYSDLPGAEEEYITFSSSFDGLRIPLGVQYYFFNNVSSFYISGGLVIGVSKYTDWYHEGYVIYHPSGTTIYEPHFQEKANVSQGPVPGLWWAIGGDIRLAKKLKLNGELKRTTTAFDIYARSKTESVTIKDLCPSLGLKYTIR
jgi:hypothetical protein